ncbi:MAG: MBL fold metallo-hydrolase [Acidobacteria bacterium]|nr:MBL fold metallo-hydrolase [Acidobacteriota bacterium]MBV9475119.1 MBL fold metallo-hydrolase [Acidobacteriota bacterium]
MTKRFLASLAFAFLALQIAAADAVKPQTLPPWTRGTLDIHQISTGRGNSAFLVLPDGTTLLIDAGAAGDGTTVPDSEPRPAAAHSAGAAIVAYIHRLLGDDAHIDYAVLTHYHADHMGQVTASSATSASGAYRLSGITEVGDRLRIGTLIDRGDAFLPPSADDATFANYHAFLSEQTRTHALHRETLRVGRADQIVLRRAASEFPTFEVRNVAANGDVWTGTRDEVRHIFPALDSLSAEDRPSENMCSIGLRIRYGRFDWFSGGDMPGVPDAGAPAWQSVESAVAKAIGPTDVHVVNHHGSIDPESAEFLQTLRSRVMILPAWSATHPSQDVLKRMLSTRLYPAPHDVFVTTLRAPTAASIGSRVSQLKAQHGHIVVRVAPGGATYSVYVLDDIDDDGAVVATFGPYTSE